MKPQDILSRTYIFQAIYAFAGYHIQDGIFWGLSGIEKAKESPPFPKICNAYSTMMKFSAVTPYLKAATPDLFKIRYF